MPMRIKKPFRAEDIIEPLEQAEPRIERRFVDAVLEGTLPQTPVDTGRLKASLKTRQNLLVSNVDYSVYVIGKTVEEEADKALNRADEIAAPELRVVVQKTQNR